MGPTFLIIIQFKTDQILLMFPLPSITIIIELTLIFELIHREIFDDLDLGMQVMARNEKTNTQTDKHRLINSIG